MADGLVSAITQLLAQQGGISAQQLLAIAAAQARAQQLNAQLQAQAQAQNGQTWATSLKQLGQLPTSVLQQYQFYSKLFPATLPSTPTSPTTWQVPLPGAGTTIQPATTAYDPTIDPTWAGTLIG